MANSSSGSGLHVPRQSKRFLRPCHLEAQVSGDGSLRRSLEDSPPVRTCARILIGWIIPEGVRSGFKEGFVVREGEGSPETGRGIGPGAPLGFSPTAASAASPTISAESEAFIVARSSAQGEEVLGLQKAGHIP